MERLFEQYDRLVVFDTETTGLDPQKNEIIEFAAAVLELKDGHAVVTQEYDNLVSLSPEGFLPKDIQELTGITPQDLKERGISKAQLTADLKEILGGERTLLLAYNAQFDLCFLYYTLLKWGEPGILAGKDKVDLLTVYKDRRAYPHRLFNAINSYALQDKVVNSHRAIDDVLATVAVMEAMIHERADLLEYVNLFGYNPRYGVGKHPIRSVTYLPQTFDLGLPLYKKRP